MYEIYWKLKERPFENTPDPKFLYHSQRHEEALSRMLYAVREQKGSALLTGEYGSGKTLLSRVILEEINNEDYNSALIFNPRLSPLDLIKEIIYQLGSDVSAIGTKINILHTLNEILYKNIRDHKKTVVVVDEAQAIGNKASFEELRLLLNFQLNNNFLLTLILLGQPELKAKINNLPQLRQRFAIRYHLTALSGKETNEYILHRLEVAGSERPLFSDNALTEIYRFSGGIPRRINNICDMALLVGCAKELVEIDEKTVREVSEDLGETPLSKEGMEIKQNG
jgi:general secretion pathway protein A